MRQRVTGRTEDPSGIPMVILLRRSALFRQLREGKVLSAANSEELQKALEALHAADDADIPGIVRALQDIDTAVDAGMAGISTVLDTANPDGDTGDLEPALVPPTASALALPDYGDEARAALEALRHGPRRGAA